MPRKGPRLTLDDPREVRRLRRADPGRVGDELLDSASWSVGLKRRSKPIVVDGFEHIALPHSDPATWPGNTSTPSGELEQPP